MKTRFLLMYLLILLIIVGWRKPDDEPKPKSKPESQAVIPADFAAFSAANETNLSNLTGLGQWENIPSIPYFPTLDSAKTWIESKLYPVFQNAHFLFPDAGSVEQTKFLKNLLSFLHEMNAKSTNDGHQVTSLYAFQKLASDYLFPLFDSALNADYTKAWVLSIFLEEIRYAPWFTDHFYDTFMPKHLEFHNPAPEIVALYPKFGVSERREFFGYFGYYVLDVLVSQPSLETDNTAGLLLEDAHDFFSRTQNILDHSLIFYYYSELFNSMYDRGNASKNQVRKYLTDYAKCLTMLRTHSDDIPPFFEDPYRVPHLPARSFSLDNKRLLGSMLSLSTEEQDLYENHNVLVVVFASDNNGQPLQAQPDVISYIAQMENLANQISCQTGVLGAVWLYPKEKMKCPDGKTVATITVRTVIMPGLVVKESTFAHERSHLIDIEQFSWFEEFADLHYSIRDSSAFASKYAMNGPFEDFAVTSEKWFMDAEGLLAMARERANNGNSALLKKVLFVANVFASLNDPNTVYLTETRDYDLSYKIGTLVRNRDESIVDIRDIRTSVSVNSGIAEQSPQNYPNPFRNFTNIPFELTQSGAVCIRISDMNGRVVQNIDLGRRYPGQHLFTWTPTGSIPDGFYVCTIMFGPGDSDSFIRLRTIKMLK